MTSIARANAWARALALRSLVTTATEEYPGAARIALDIKHSLLRRGLASMIRSLRKISRAFGARGRSSARDLLNWRI
jgi:hypothetical protein